MPSKQPKLTKRQIESIVTALQDKLQEAGARHNREDNAMVQTIHDHAVSLGAACPMASALDVEENHV